MASDRPREHSEKQERQQSHTGKKQDIVIDNAPGGCYIVKVRVGKYM